MLRLNFTNTNITESNLTQLLNLLNLLDLEHLELFLGGNSSVNDEFLITLSEIIEAQKLRGLEIDIGYTSCTNTGMKSFFRFTKPKLVRLGIYLNG